MWRKNDQEKRSDISPCIKDRSEDKFHGDKVSQCFKCEGFGNIKGECTTFINKHKKGLSAILHDSESEEETTNIYPGQCKFDGESSTEDLSQEEVDVSFTFLHSKWKGVCVKIEN